MEYCLADEEGNVRNIALLTISYLSWTDKIRRICNFHIIGVCFFIFGVCFLRFFLLSIKICLRSELLINDKTFAWDRSIFNIYKCILKFQTEWERNSNLHLLLYGQLLLFSLKLFLKNWSIIALTLEITFVVLKCKCEG
jgi:hypothetical protein